MYRTTNRPNTRIEVADALRGIAVAGIILFHAREHFNLYWSALDLPRAGFGSWEQPVADALGFLLSGKMYAIFALLFGLSFFIQSDNQAQRGNDFSRRFAWRMVLLFGIGLVNAAIYNGDVLTYYALFGLLMIPIGFLLCRCMAKLLTIRLTFVAISIVVLSFIGAYAISNSIVDIWVVAVFGFVGFFGGKLGMDTGAMALGVILGPMIEENLGKCLDLAHSVEGGLPAIMFGSTISQVLIFALALSLATPYLLHLKKLREQERQAKCLCDSERKEEESNNA